MSTILFFNQCLIGHIKKKLKIIFEWESMFRWGVIGTGNIAKIVCDKIEKSKRHKVVAVYSRTQKRAEKFALRYNSNCYADKEKFFEDKNIDAIYIATPHSAHYEYLLECINHNIPVLSEKSFTVNEMQAKAVFDLAKQKKVFVCEAMWTRFQPLIEDIKEWIKQGMIGQVKSFDGKFCMPMGLIKPFVPKRVYLKEYAGGAMLDLGVYPISFSEMLLGKPDKIVCRQKIQDGIDMADDIELHYDNGVCRLYSSLEDLTSFTGTIYGSEGKIVIPNFTRPKKAYLYQNGKKTETKKGKCSYVYEFDKCCEDIKNGLIESSVMTFQNTLNVMNIMDECRRQNNLVYPENIEKV